MKNKSTLLILVLLLIIAFLIVLINTVAAPFRSLLTEDYAKLRVSIFTLHAMLEEVGKNQLQPGSHESYEIMDQLQVLQEKWVRLSSLFLKSYPERSESEQYLLNTMLWMGDFNKEISIEEAYQKLPELKDKISRIYAIFYPNGEAEEKVSNPSVLISLRFSTDLNETLLQVHQILAE
mgnify:CR=1 FL=1